jgi:DHA1 family bicyclomycin/chloramphenicol resistance-like MFS transporter
VTTVDTRTSPRAALSPGTRPFIAVLSMCMAVTALGIDTALPAFPDIREAFGLADDATEVTAIVTTFFIGSSLGLLPAGLLADRFGRRAVMWGGLALYVAGAIGSVLAPTLGSMLVARFVWGLGSSGPRVAALAMVRDAYEGEQMARQMSLIMAVFILVPTFAPTLSVGILALGPWQAVFLACAAIAVVVSGGVARLPETLPVAERRPLAVREIGRSCAIVLRTPGTVGYLVSLTALFGVFMSYLASSEIILDQVFDLAEWFPLFFGGIAIAMGAAMWTNGRFVERLGLPRIIRIGFAANWLATVALLGLTLATSGRPGFWPFVVLLAVVLFFQQMLIPNLNAAAMRPLAHVAGTGAAILGMVPGVLGAVIGNLIDRRFDGSITPLAIGFVVASSVAAISWRGVATRAVRV